MGRVHHEIFKEILIRITIYFDILGRLYDYYNVVKISVRLDENKK